MNKRVIIGVIAILIVCAIGAAVYFTSQPQKSDSATTLSTTAEEINKEPANLELWETYDYNYILPPLLQPVRNSISIPAATSTPTTQETDSLTQLLSPLVPLLDVSLTYGPALGCALDTDTAAINAILGSNEVRALLPADLVTSWTAKPMYEDDNHYQLIALRAGKDGQPAMSGDIVKWAIYEYDRNQAIINISMTDEATQQWEELTGKNIGKSIAIVIDGEVYSWPTVGSTITCGALQITGNLTIKEAKALSQRLSLQR